MSHSAHHNKKRKMALPLDEFLRRFFLHVLPRGFVRIRHFGFLAHRRRAKLLPLCRQLIADSGEPTVTAAESTTGPAPPVWQCPQCGGDMVIVERLTASQMRLRSPPAGEDRP